MAVVLRAAAFLITAALVGPGAAAPARAIVAAVPIDRPVPQSLQAPLRNFLERLGIPHVDAALSGTKTLPFHADGNILVFRVEHPDSCVADLCLTILARLESGSIVSDLMFPAGRMFIGSDATHDAWGRSSWPMSFRSGDAILTVMNTPQGWLVIPDRNQLPAAYPPFRQEVPDSTPAPVQQDGFEQFRSILESLR